VQGITRSYLPGNPEGWLKTLWLRSANDGQLGTSMEGIHGFGIVLPQSSFQQGKNKVEIVDLQEWAKTHSFHPDFLPSGPSQP
jgi:hypothetical protein